jgi:hypothetical protein
LIHHVFSLFSPFLKGILWTPQVQSFDQTFDKMNKALLASCERGLPVRVVRSHKVPHFLLLLPLPHAITILSQNPAPPRVMSVSCKPAHTRHAKQMHSRRGNSRDQGC